MQPLTRPNRVNQTFFHQSVLSRPYSRKPSPLKPSAAKTSPSKTSLPAKLTPSQSPLLSSLSPHKSQNLKHLARKCGLSPAGTKAELLARLVSAASQPTAQQHSTPRRILSIDMGIRNLAYTLLSVPASNSDAGRSTPKVLEWRRLALSFPASDPAVQAKGGEENKPDLSYDPQRYAATAYELLKETLLPLNPTHILIERQRFRSGGGAAVQEWTLRVNMLEGMIYACLHTLSQEKGGLAPSGTGEQGKELVVEGVSPARVAGFWLGDDEKGVKKGGKGGAAGKKVAKIGAVRGWLEGGVEVEMGNKRSEAVREGFLGKCARGGAKSKQKTRATKKSKTTGAIEEGVEDDETGKQQPLETLTKTDDLADCLLQGVAYVRWLENRRLLASLGAEGLLESKP